MKSFKFSLVFFFAFSVTIYAQSDRPKQKYDDLVPKTALSTNDTTPAYRLWCSINQSLSEMPEDSSQANLHKEVVIFSGVKMLLSKNDGRFVSVSRWEIVNKQFIIIFSPDNSNKIERNVLSFSKLGGYKEIKLSLIIGEEEKEFELSLYTVNNIKTKDLTKIRLKI